MLATASDFSTAVSIRSGDDSHGLVTTSSDNVDSLVYSRSDLTCGTHTSLTNKRSRTSVPTIAPEFSPTMSIRPVELGASESQVLVNATDDVIYKKSTESSKSRRDSKQERRFSLRNMVGGFTFSLSRSEDESIQCARTNTIPTPRMSALFSMEETWIRATHLATLLFGTSAILSSSEGGPESYDLSYEVKQIDYFVSHNWSASRWKKFMALFLHFCGRSAMLVGYCCAAIGCVLNRFSIPPLLQLSPNMQYGIWCQVLGFTGVLSAILFSHKLLSLQQLGKPPLTAFLDKVCIHQTDEEKKQAGIAKLGGFLRHSKTMISLFNNLYCKKLWTVYELACFMYIHPGDDLVLIPLDLANVVFKSAVAVWGMILSSAFILHINSYAKLFGNDDVYGIYSVVGCSIASVAYGIFSVTLRRWGIEQETTILDLQSFNVGDARCAIENDRKLVCKNIRSFVRAMQLVEVDDDDNAALECFNTLVQKTMPIMLKDAVGRTGFPYKYVIMVCTPHDFLLLDYISSQCEKSPRWIIGALIHGLSMRAVVIPVGFLLCASLCKRFPKRQGAAEVLTRISIYVLTTLTVATLFVVSGSLSRIAHASHSMVILFGLFLFVMTMALLLATVASSRPQDPSELSSMASIHRESLDSTGTSRE